MGVGPVTCHSLGSLKVRTCKDLGQNRIHIVPVRTLLSPVQLEAAENQTKPKQPQTPGSTAQAPGTPPLRLTSTRNRRGWMGPLMLGLHGILLVPLPNPLSLTSHSSYRCSGQSQAGVHDLHGCTWRAPGWGVTPPEAGCIGFLSRSAGLEHHSPIGVIGSGMHPYSPHSVPMCIPLPPCSSGPFPDWIQAGKLLPPTWISAKLRLRQTLYGKIVGVQNLIPL